MNLSNTKLKLAAIATGIALLITGTAFLYWQVSRRYWCVRTISTGSQEVTYSVGCVHPQRYRQWSITASAEPGKL
jgi:cytochrome oxidase assembly protein ShyY1